MTLTIEDDLDLVCQMTQHALLVPWGRFAGHVHLKDQLSAALTLKHHQDATPVVDLILEFGLASLAGAEYLRDLNLGAHPLVKDQAVADAWGIKFRHYTTVSRLLYELDEAAVAQVETALVTSLRPYLQRAVHQVLCRQEYLSLCGDLTGRPVSPASTTYPPDSVFGYMARQLQRGHQAALVTLHGLSHRVHITTFQRPGDTISGACLGQMVEQTEQRLACRPRRRTELVRHRLGQVEAKISQKQAWVQTQTALIRQQLERQIRVGEQLRTLVSEIVRLEAAYQDKPGRPGAQVRRAYQRRQRWQDQLSSALRQEAQARQVRLAHQQQLETLQQERERLVHHLARLELDNAHLPHPVRMRWLLDGAFSETDNLTYLIELGYDLYTIGNGQTTLALLQHLPPEATWTPLYGQVEALEMSRQQVGHCPYPLRLTLLRWPNQTNFKHSTLVSFSDSQHLPTTALFPTYHQRQDVEAGIKQGKSTFSLTKLRLRSAAGIALLGQFALFFWPNFVHWAAEWLADQLDDQTGHFRALLPQVRPQVRIAANTPALILTTPQDQLLQFDADGPFAGVQINLDGPLAYQLPMPLFQAWSQLWPISSSSVKEQVATLQANPKSRLLAQPAVDLPQLGQPEKIPEF